MVFPRFLNVERTLCLHGNGVPVVQEVTVVVSTSSQQDIFFDLRLFQVQDFALGVNDMGEVPSLGILIVIKFDIINIYPR